MRAQHQRLAAEHGQQPQRIVTEAAQRPGVELRPEQTGVAAQEGVTYARERGMEREAVADERTLMRDALKHTMGEARLPEVRAEFERRVRSQELIEVERRPGLAGRAFTTGEMQGYERELIERMKLGQGNARGIGRRSGTAADDGAASALELEPAERGRRCADEPRPHDGA